MKFVSSILLVLIAVVCYAGDGNKRVLNHVGGKIVDHKTGEPLTGVKLTETLTGRAIYTDLDGNFSLDFYDKEVHTVEISYISYEEKKIVVESNRSNNTIVIELDGAELY